MAGVWELGQSLSDKGGLLCLHCIHDGIYVKHLLSFWGSGILLHGGKGCLMLDKSFWTHKLAWVETWHACCWGGRMNFLCAALRGRESIRGHEQGIPTVLL